MVGYKPSTFVRDPFDQGYETNRNEVLGFDPALASGNANELLVVMTLADRHDQDTVDIELIDEKLRRLWRCGGHYYSREWRLLGPALVAIARPGRDVVQAEFGKSRFRLGQQTGVPLNRINPPTQFAQNGGLISRTGANFEHSQAVVQPQRLGHVRNDVGLADRLALIDRQRVVVVGTIRKRVEHEGLAGHPLDGSEHAGVGNALFAQLHDQSKHARVDRDGF